MSDQAVNRQLGFFHRWTIVMGYKVITPWWICFKHNGMRQGGIFSPILFNLYVDELSECLNVCKTGCMIRNTLVNHIIYADDLVVFSPSSAGLQQLLTLCSYYGHEHYILYNPNKSVVMICRTKEDKSIHFAVFKLSNKSLTVCAKVKYLGHFITERMIDDEDIERQHCMMYIQANILLRKFSFCSDEVKESLFKVYCTTLCCSFVV